MQPVARDRAQRLLRHGLRANLRQLALTFVGILLEQCLGDDEFEHRVAEELKPLVVLHTLVLVRERAVGERLDEQIGLQCGAERGEQLLHCRFADFLRAYTNTHNAPDSLDLASLHSVVCVPYARPPYREKIPLRNRGRFDRIICPFLRRAGDAVGIRDAAGMRHAR